MDQFFKKPSGVVFKANSNHDIASLKARFIECDENGKEIKKTTKKTPKNKAKAKKETN